MKLGEGMRRGIIRRKPRRRKRQRRKLGIRLVRYRLSRVGVGLGDLRRVVEGGIGVLRLKDKHRGKDRRDLLLSSGNNNSDPSSLLLNNNNPRNNNTEVRLSNINLLLSNISLLPSSINNNNHNDHPNSNNNNHTNKSPVDIHKDKDRDNNKIDYLHRVINRRPSHNNNNKRNKDGQINLNPLHSLSLRKQYLLLINLGIDPPRHLLRLNNRRIMNLGLCTFTPPGLFMAVVGICG